VAIDPARGRLAFSPLLDPHRVLVSFSYGFSGDLGGGPYDRTASLEAADRVDDTGATRRGFRERDVWQAGVSHLGATAGASGQVFGSLREAVAAWNALPPAPGRAGVIAVMDSVSEHDVGGPDDPVVVVVGERARLLIVAADWPLEEDPEDPTIVRRRPGRLRALGVRPHYVGDLVVRGGAPAESADPGELFLNGLLVEGGVRVAEGLGLLALEHCTLVPEVGGLSVLGANERLRLVLRRSITGPLAVPEPIRGLAIADCVVDGTTGSPEGAVLAETTECDLQRSTVLGPVRVQILSASECIFTGAVTAARRQVGCVRFSYVPPGSAVPRRYRCQPDAGASARVVPAFTSRRYGDPGYAQLARRCAGEIRTGAEGGGEMGAFRFLEQPQREANLRGALQDYLRLGLEVGVVHVT
jgi:hypothetical protein